MPLLVIGISHNTAPVELRERMVFEPCRLSVALKQLNVNPCVNSSVILSTCNRSEIYCDLKASTKERVVDWFFRFHNISPNELKSSIYIYEEQATIKHLMRVSCGLDSLVLGEPQILGQVKKAYSYARKFGTVNSLMEKLFQKTFFVAKRVRTETEIGFNAVSIAYAACTLAKHIFESLSNSTILLVGAGENIQLVAKYLANGCKKIIIANRTLKNALKLSEKFSAYAISLAEIPEYLPRADIVISSTASPLPILGKGLIETALKIRKYQPMLLVDIAVPRDIESQVAVLDNVYLYSIDDLKLIVDSNIKQREVESIQAESIINEESDRFTTRIRSLQAVDSIREYRKFSNDIRQDLLNRSLQSLAAGSDPERVLMEFSNKLTNKLIHAPTRALQNAAERGESSNLVIIRKSLGLEDFYYYN
ncbi:glutamyl-tRNA reductase [Candidatus Photodesmus katoptron]|uniref:Glutamyl-tRNA reductase n=1 Tax=Candidatus Photodesmus katoptron Akat1 TaxID=1236703 RepID=S3E190_9GAMM|nr:glutamyl-tRNA reductase [Candidatus Photodesmus katoptron]EPE37951.1 glutamyl-tRNA reductase [Candidatus Photodesmus katoptron Akat1]KEY90262.1 glutamyl-tRNA reductase [Candidatus Photodesmus katoptron]